MKTFETWLRIVLGLSCSCRAICGLVWCCATSARIWCSRSVSWGKALVGALGRGVAKKSIRRLAISGPKIASPLVTARTARRISD